MPTITIDNEEAMRILKDADSSADARVIAGLTVALFELNTSVDDIDRATRSITLKLAHMIAAVIYDNPKVTP